MCACAVGCSGRGQSAAGRDDVVVVVVEELGGRQDHRRRRRAGGGGLGWRRRAGGGGRLLVVADAAAAVRGRREARLLRPTQLARALLADPAAGALRLRRHDRGAHRAAGIARRIRIFRCCFFRTRKT